MNERIKELAEQAGFVVGVSANADRQIKHFAELVRQDEREQAEKQEPKRDKPLRLSPIYEYGHIHDAGQPEEFVRWSKEKEFFDAAHASQQAEKQEPVAWVCEGFGKQKHNIDYDQEDVDALPVGTMLYTSPPRKEWVGLTDDDLRQIILVSIGVAEAKLKEKNGG
jgi:hypothetical protein